MMYSKIQFGNELLYEIDRGFEVVRLSRWAYSKYLSHTRNLEEGLRKKMMIIIAMEEGPEFEMSESELRLFALNMISGKA